jgi:D-ribitol-5-phosphate cytidylyltransferase
MIFAAILAGGTGTRMGNIEKPKQFLLLGKKPIIIHTIEKFYINNNFKEIIVLCPKKWINHTENLINKYISNSDSIKVIEGGKLRNDTIMNAISYIESKYSWYNESDSVNNENGSNKAEYSFENDKNENYLTNESIIVTHDSVRPFITHRIIEENIQYSKEYGACDTVIPATDTIVESRDSKFINNIPNRDVMYQGQTPQSFKINKLKKFYNELSNEERETLTDACKIFSMREEKVFIVEGDITNIKITYPHDLRLANSILKGK